MDTVSGVSVIFGVDQTATHGRLITVELTPEEIHSTVRIEANFMIFANIRPAETSSHGFTQSAASFGIFNDLFQCVLSLREIHFRIGNAVVAQEGAGAGAMAEKIHRIFRKLEVKRVIRPGSRALAVSIFLPTNIQEAESILKAGAILVADRVAELIGKKVVFIFQTGLKGTLTRHTSRTCP